MFLPSLSSSPASCRFLVSRLMQPWRGSKQIPSNNEALHHRNSPIPRHAIPLLLTYKHLDTALSVTKPAAVVLDARHAWKHTGSQQRLGGEHPPPVPWQILRGRIRTVRSLWQLRHTRRCICTLSKSVGTTAHNQSVLVRSGSRFHVDRLSADSKLQHLIIYPHSDCIPAAGALQLDVSNFMHNEVCSTRISTRSTPVSSP